MLPKTVPLFFHHLPSRQYHYQKKVNCSATSKTGVIRKAIIMPTTDHRKKPFNYACDLNYAWSALENFLKIAIHFGTCVLIIEHCKPSFPCHEVADKSTGQNEFVKCPQSGELNREFSRIKCNPKHDLKLKPAWQMFYKETHYEWTKRQRLGNFLLDSLFLKGQERGCI